MERVDIPNFDTKVIVKCLEAIRSHKNFSISFLCKMSGISPATYNRYRNHDAIPTLPTLAKLLGAMKIPLSVFFFMCVDFYDNDVEKRKQQLLISSRTHRQLVREKQIHLPVQNWRGF